MSRYPGMEAVALVRARCLLCYSLAQYQPQALHLRLYPQGRITLSFFCVHCREESCQPVAIIETAEALTAAGVTTELVEVNPEWLEHDPDAPPISSTEIFWMEQCTEAYFDMWVQMLCEAHGA